MPFLDATGEVYHWLTGAVPTDVRLSMPEGAREFPLILVQRIGGRPGFAGDWARFQFDCFGSLGDMSRMEANEAAYRLAAVLDAVTAKTGGAIKGGEVVSIRELLDPEAPYARTMVEALVYVKAVN